MVGWELKRRRWDPVGGRVFRLDGDYHQFLCLSLPQCRHVGPGDVSRDSKLPGYESREDYGRTLRIGKKLFLGVFDVSAKTVGGRDWCLKVPGP